MSLMIRPLERSDDEAAVSIYNAYVTTEPTTVESVRKRRPLLPKWVGFIAEVDGKPVGAAECFDPAWLTIPNKLLIHYALLPEAIGTEIEQALYRHLFDHAVGLDPDTIIAPCESRRPNHVANLEHDGFKRALVLYCTQIDLDTFHPEAFSSQIAGLNEQGIQLVSLATLIIEDPQWRQRYLDLINRVMPDVPHVAEVRETPMEVFIQLTSGDSFVPEARFMAVSGDRYVGVSELQPSPNDPTQMNTGFTGIDREFRRQGLATALKATALGWAKSVGARHVTTDNEVNNPMYLLNKALGFQDIHQIYHYRLDRR